VRRANEVFLNTGRLHAYDPYFMAGYPSAIFDLDVKGAEVFCSVVPAGAVASAMKVFILVCYLTMVFTVYLGCRYLGFTKREAFLSLMLILVYWHWGRPYASHFRYAGMFGFVCISHLSILVVGLFNRFLSGRGVIPFFVLGPVAFFIHPTAVIILAMPLLLLVVLRRVRSTFKTSLVFLLWWAAVVLVNAVWIVPLLTYAHTKSASDVFFQMSGMPGLIGVLCRPGCLPTLVLLALGVVGIWRLCKERRIVEAVVPALTAVFLFFVAAYGVYLPGLRHLEPGRFLLPALFFLAPLAGCGTATVLERLEGLRMLTRGRHLLERSAVLVLVLIPILFSYLSATTGYRHRLSTTLHPEVRDLVEAVRAYTDRSGRLMIEDGPAALYREVHLPGLLPMFTGVEQIGGPYPFAFVEHHFATFQQNKTAGKPLSEITPRELRAYTDLYNVRWILTATRETDDLVARMAAGSDAPRRAPSVDGALAEVIWKSPRYTLWRVRAPGTFTGGEDDRVRASFNRIEIDLARVSESVLLKYHWDEGLTVSPPATISPVYQLDDPVPFVILEPNGASSIVIEY
jgi:hypothetical protein